MEDTTRAVSRPRSAKFWLWRSLTALVIVVGAGVVAYPFAAQWNNQNHELKRGVALVEQARTASDDLKAERRSVAEHYNQDLASGEDLSSYDYFALGILEPGGPIARVRVPSIGVDQSVHHTLDESVLNQGLGHMEGTSLPIGGVDTNAVIGGHRGHATATGLTNLDKMQIGDPIYIDSLGEHLVYQAVSYEVLSPGDADMQPVQPGKDLVTLVTCTPIGLNTERIVVVAERVDEDAQAAVVPEMVVSMFPWWGVAFGGAVLAAGLYLAWPALPRRVA